MTDGNPYAIKPIVQLIYLVLVCFGCAIIGAVVSAIIITGLFGSDMFSEIQSISMSSSPQAIAAYKILIAVANTTFTFLVPAIFFGYLIVHRPHEYLKTGFSFSWQLLVVALAIMLTANGVIEMLVNINRQLSLPASMKGIEDWMKTSELEAERVINIVLNTDSVGGLLVSVLIIGVLPALAEEFLFRGCLQTIFQRWTGNPHAAVWITAALFSAFHMQFFGFLPRLALGVLFGYMVVWSGSIWPAVWAHFINNGSAVIALYLYKNKTIDINPNSEHIFNYQGYIISLVFMLFLLWVFKNVARRHAEYRPY